jgi:hypothetical protein
MPESWLQIRDLPHIVETRRAGKTGIGGVVQGLKNRLERNRWFIEDDRDRRQYSISDYFFIGSRTCLASQKCQVKL